MYIEMPVELYEWLAAQAEKNRRSVKSELVSAVEKYRLNPDIVQSASAPRRKK